MSRSSRTPKSTDIAATTAATTTEPRGRTRGKARTGPRKARTTRGNRPPGHSAYRRALRREAPTLVGLLLDERDFTAMAAYPSFPFRDYALYLEHLESLLRSLHAQGTSVTVTLFEPGRFAAHCAQSDLPPDSRASRVAYTAEAGTAGPTLRYDRQPLALLRAQLAREADQRATFDHAADLLAAAGPCTDPDCDRPFAHCAFDYAAHTLLSIVEAAGPGTHHFVCSVPADEGPALLTAAHVTTDLDGEVQVSHPEGLALCTVLAAAQLAPSPGGLVLRSSDHTGTDTVRGWSLHPDGPRALNEAEVFNAYCTDPDTGQPVPPEPGVRYRAGFPLTPPPPDGHDPFTAFTP